jgi:hypothetical protein
VIRKRGFLPVALAAALLGSAPAHAGPNDDYIATISQHGVLIINNRDVVEGIVMGEEVCKHISDGSTPTAERGRLRRVGETFDQAVWIVRAAQTDLCPDTGIDTSTTIGLAGGPDIK